VNTPPAKAGGFRLRLKAGLIGHAADLHLNAFFLIDLVSSLALFPQLFKPTQRSINKT
jgi:hypothetical protein